MARLGEKLRAELPPGATVRAAGHSLSARRAGGLRWARGQVISNTYGFPGCGVSQSKNHIE
jgi:hypothetical protein